MVSHSYRSQSETRVPNFYTPWERGGGTRGRAGDRGQKGASQPARRDAETGVGRERS